ncbi:hypothetical protein SO802_017398 [Lithocarpus litseifolius]|uniref:SWIM-type domain-containing protein n=1 Tax=Lithocarpus litseifolius TaxID=425828 RepID=A0AAW2CL75_9ROSI
MKVHTFNEGDLASEMDLFYRVPYFERLYICLEGCKKEFLAGCRPIIGLDAYHLKTKSGGQLIIAVARDPNEEYFPLAYAIVETKTKDSWTWFINLLLADIAQNTRWTFISDQQKHRICCRHLYNNFRKNQPGVLIRALFWKAAKATYKAEFDRVMDELKEIDEDAHNWLQTHSTTIWAKHIFSEDWLIDTVISYDQVLGEQTNDTLFACWAGHTQFKVKNGLQSFTVDLAKAHCSCRKWDITGIPCAQIITCIFFNKQDAEQYLHKCFNVSTYKVCYELIIAPINRQNMWRPNGVQPV